MTSDPNPQPTGARKLRVMICTPLRFFPTEPAEQVKFLQDRLPQIGRALRELAIRTDEPFATESRKYTFEFVAVVGGLCRARNSAVHDFLKAEGDFLVWWDSDLDATAEHILRMLSHRQPIVGGMYCKRGGKRPKWVGTFIPAAELQLSADGLLQVAEWGGGLKCIYRKTFTELARLFPTIMYRERETGEKIFGFYQNLVLDGDLLSEDYYLDYLARCAGIPILADTKIKIRHRDADGTYYPEGDFPPIPCDEGK